MSHAPADTHTRLQPPLQRAALVELDLDALAALLQLPAGARISHLVAMPEAHRQVVLCVTGAGPMVSSGTTLRRFRGWATLSQNDDGSERVAIKWPGLVADELEVEP